MTHDSGKPTKYEPIPGPILPVVEPRGWRSNYAPVLEPYQPRVRSRALSHTRKLGVMTDSAGSTSTVWYTDPEIEGCVDELHSGPPYLKGGPFALQHYLLDTKTDAVKVTATGFLQRKYSGKMVPRTYVNFQSPATLAHLPLISSAQMDVYGTSCWNRFKPGKPGADTAQFLWELQRLPSIDILVAVGKEILGMKRNLRKILNIGNRYLDFQFGWKPFLRDVQKLYEVQNNLSKLMKQLAKDNGRPIRRKGILFESTTVVHPEVTDFPFTLLYPPLWGESYATLRGTRTSGTKLHTKVWFSGRFRYYIPDLGTDEWTNRVTRKLYDVELTPGVLWEIMPWSWLIDWFTNFGDVIHNLTDNAAENLVADYAYVMATQKWDNTLTETQPLLNNGAVVNASATLHNVRTTKQRQPASPFNFGTTPANLSIRQGLILAALGISRIW